MQQGARLKGLDDFKWIAAALVVAIHTSPLESINETADFLLTRVLARLAVPFFLMVTGYFVLYGAYAAGDSAKIRRFLFKLLCLYLATTLLYLPVRLYQFLGEWTLYRNIAPMELLLQAGRAFFFDGTYYHLWYLPAVVLGLILVWGGLSILGRTRTFLCAWLLYLIGLFGDSYYGVTAQIPLLNSLYEVIFKISSHTRNGLFFAPLFLLLGYEVAVRTQLQAGPDSQSDENGSIRKESALFFFGTLLLMCGEGLGLHILRLQRHDSMYLLLPFCMQGLFALLLSCKGIWSKTQDFNTKAQWKAFYEKGPMLLYCLHPAVILILRGFVKVTGFRFMLTISPLYYLIVLGGSLCLVYICIRIRGVYESVGERKKHF
ncbi:MAG: acyltransferase [Lachnospiraceae bacterium]|nr:acyltransferase [Lachnospiraceae bacterium]